MKCPLCLNKSDHRTLKGADKRKYHLCDNCKLIFADKTHYISTEDEKKYYSTHENSIGNEGYVKFLNRIVEPVSTYLNESMHGLDYGCGPGPVVSKLLAIKGIECDDHDPFFCDTEPKDIYDFIISTETFEHFHDPRKELEKISSLLNEGGILGIMTELWKTETDFEKWYYTKDPTHVCFYHSETFDYICSEFGFEILETDSARVLILRKGKN